MIMTGGNQNEFECPFRTFEAVAKMFGKSAKTVGRWVQTIPGFPHPVRVGCSRLRFSKGFAGDLAVYVHPWLVPSGNGENRAHSALRSEAGERSGRQDSNLQDRPDLEALTTVAPQLAPQGCYWQEEVGEIASAWADLPDALKAAVLGIVRSVRKEGK